MVEKEKRIKKDGYTLVGYYIEGIGSDYCGPVSWLDRCELDDDNVVWVIGAEYAKNLRPTYYYVIAKNKRDAIRKFKSRLPWMKYISKVEPVPSEDAERLLKDPMKILC